MKPILLILLLLCVAGCTSRYAQYETIDPNGVSKVIIYSSCSLASSEKADWAALLAPGGWKLYLGAYDRDNDKIKAITTVGIFETGE